LEGFAGKLQSQPLWLRVGFSSPIWPSWVGLVLIEHFVESIIHWLFSIQMIGYIIYYLVIVIQFDMSE
jgi:hypothetical protein